LFVLWSEKETQEQDFETYYSEQIERAVNRVHKVLERRGAMQVRIDSVSDVTNDPHKGTSSKITCGGINYFVQEDATPHLGKMVEITSEERKSRAGNKYNVAKIVRVLGEAAAGTPNGGITWNDYQNAVKLAHGAALALEPDLTDENGVTLVDRSMARARLVNTAMIAFSNGRIFIPEDEIPF
jgi:hypothetical protein